MVLFMDSRKSSKHKFQYKFRSYKIIYIIKNYFVAVFSDFSKYTPNIQENVKYLQILEHIIVKSSWSTATVVRKFQKLVAF